MDPVLSRRISAACVRGPRPAVSSQQQGAADARRGRRRRWLPPVPASAASASSSENPGDVEPHQRAVRTGELMRRARQTLPFRSPARPAARSRCGTGAPAAAPMTSSTAVIAGWGDVMRMRGTDPSLRDPRQRMQRQHTRPCGAPSQRRGGGGRRVRLGLRLPSYGGGVVRSPALDAEQEIHGRLVGGRELISRTRPTSPIGSQRHKPRSAQRRRPVSSDPASANWRCWWCLVSICFPRRSALAGVRGALGGHRRRRVGVFESISAPGARLQPLFRPAGDVRHGHAAGGAGRQRRGPLHRVGVRRPQLGAARRVLSRAARSGVECPSRVLGLPHQRRRHAVGGGPAAPRRGHRQPLAPVWRRRRGVDGRV